MKASAALINVLRFSLAGFVVFFHLSGFAQPHLGPVAVIGFFCISGFLVTLISNDVYSGRPLHYVANRALRIYPMYWACASLGLLAIILWPEMNQVNSGMVLPASPETAVPQVLIFGLDLINTRILPTAWSLSIELYFYAIVGLITARSFSLTCIGTALCVALAILCVFHIIPFDFFGSAIGSSHAFFLGSLSWHLRGRMSRWPPIYLPLSLLLFTVLGFGPTLGSSTVNVFLAALVGAFVVVSTTKSETMISRQHAKVTEFLGRLAYPIFLLHSPIAGVLWVASGFRTGLMLTIIATCITVPLSAALVFFVEIPMEAYRKRIRASDQGLASPP